jgi:hypothetical protein
MVDADPPPEAETLKELFPYLNSELLIDKVVPAAAVHLFALSKEEIDTRFT